MGSILIFLGAFFFVLAAEKLRSATPSITVFSFWAVGNFGLGIIGLCAAAAGMVILRRAPK
jgi:hypothetical protein